MRLVYSHVSPDANVVEAVAFVNALNDDDAFWRQVSELPSFTQTDDPKYTPALISQRMQACDDEVKVLHYRASLSSATAYVDPDRPFCIFLNTAKFGRTVASQVNTLVHEFVHVVDMFADGEDTGEWDYGHTRKYTDERPRSAPYAIGSFAESYWRQVNQHIGSDDAKLTEKVDLGGEGLDCDIQSLDEALIDN